MFLAYFISQYLDNLILYIDLKKKEYLDAHMGVSDKPAFDMNSATLSWFDTTGSPVVSSALSTQGENFLRNLLPHFIKRGRELAAENRIHSLTEEDVINWLK